MIRDRAFDKFSDTPFRDCSIEEPILAIFSNADDPYFYDLIARRERENRRALA